MSPVVLYCRAIQRLARHHRLTYGETEARFGGRLVHIQCNIVTADSLSALLGEVTP